jgi:hypothetical protein
MEGGGMWTNMVMGDDVDVAGLDDLTFPMTQDTHQMYEVPSEVQPVDVQVKASQGVECPRSAKGLSKRTKNFDPKEDEVVCSAWSSIRDVQGIR